MLVLDDKAWKQEQEQAAQRFFSCAADEFVKRFNAGEFDPTEHHDLMYVLSFFPEVD